MEQSPFWEANRSSPTQEIPRILWNTKVHYRIHNSRHLSLSSVRSIQYMPPSHFSKINSNIIPPSTAVSSKGSPSIRFTHQNPVCTSPLPHTSHTPCLVQILFLALQDYFHVRQNLYRACVTYFCNVFPQLRTCYFNATNYPHYKHPYA